MESQVLTDRRTLELQERPRPEPEDGSVVLEVDACGVCMTDYHMYHGTFPVDTPVVLGHESTGTVVEVGAGTQNVEVGQRVALFPSVPCGSCRACRAGDHNRCTNLIGIGAAADTVVDGSFAEYVTVPEQSVVPVDGLTPDVAALTEPLACCVHGVDQTSIQTGDTVVVIGAGSIGLLLMQTFDAAGAGQLIVSEPVPDRRRLAEELGADVTIDPYSENVVETVDRHTDHVDIAAEVVGTMPTVEQAIELPSPGGETLIFGVPPQDQTIEISPFDVYYNESDILGSFGSNLDTTQRAVELLKYDRVEAEPIITERYGLSDLERAFEQMEDQDGLKKLIRP